MLSSSINETLREAWAYQMQINADGKEEQTGVGRR